MSKEFRLKELYKKVPYFECKKGCHDCCGPVPFTNEELDKIAPKAKATGLDCPYVTDDGCVIYENRPFMCRIFGTVKNLRCPHGCRPIKILSTKQGKKLMSKYMKLFDL